MPIDTKKYINTIDTGIKADKEFKEFLIYIKVNNKKYRKVLNYYSKNWDKRTRISEAKKETEQLKNKSNNSSIKDSITLNEFSQRIFNTYKPTKWNKTKISYYNTYIYDNLGKMKIKNIAQINIKELITRLEKKGLKARTVKTALEIINPIFKDAISNKIILSNPCDNVIVKRPNTKKIVLNATDKLNEVHEAISKVFKNDPYYYSLFMFALQGRRKSEILNLKWEDIDFKNNYYLLPKTKSGFEQKFYLPENIKNKLQLIRTDNIYVFNSKIIKNKPIQNITDQIKKLKNVLWEDFHIHYCRNIISSAMSEQGIEAIFQSGALGHNDPNTIKQYTSLDYIKGSKEADKVISNIINL